MWLVLRIGSFLVLGGFLLSGCSGLGEQLGLGKTSPDEFRVVSRAPLTLPPDFNLRPPDPGAPRPQSGTPADQAKQAVFKIEGDGPQVVDDSMPEDGRSIGERAFLVSAGATYSDPAIRQIVNAETDRINSENEDFLRSLILWRREPPPGVVVDPEGESKRLQENATLGKSVTEGETPVIERKEKALFEF